MALALPKSKLYEANANSAAVWQADLIKLFHHAKERYADVVWELVPDGETDGEEVWGHKGQPESLCESIWRPGRLYSDDLVSAHRYEYISNPIQQLSSMPEHQQAFKRSTFPFDPRPQLRQTCITMESVQTSLHFLSSWIPHLPLAA